MNHYRVLIENLDHIWIDIEAHNSVSAINKALERAHWGVRNEEGNPKAKVQTVVQFYPEKKEV